MKRILLFIPLFFTLLSYSYGSGFGSRIDATPGIVAISEGTGSGTDEFQGTDDDQPKVVFYPNPTRDYLNVKFSEKGEHLIRVYNIVGEQIMKKSVYDGDLITLDVSALQKGMYFLSYELNGKVVTKTFSKEQ